MAHDSLTYHTLSTILLLALPVGCTRTEDEPAEAPVPVVEGSREGAKSEPVSPDIQDTAERSASELVEESTPRRIDIELPETPPTGDAVEPGTYVLSISIELDNGGSVNDRHACTVEIEDETMTLRMDRSKGDPVVGTLKGGRLVLKAREGEATYGLEGQVVGPGQLRGTVVAGEGLKGVRIVDGRWALDRVK